jgi:hypothetical protein
MGKMIKSNSEYFYTLAFWDAPNRKTQQMCWPLGIYKMFKDSIPNICIKILITNKYVDF